MRTLSRFSGLWLAAALPFGASAGLPDETIEPSINAELAEHTRHFREKVYPIADNVWSAVGWNLANSVMIEAPEGLIIVDTGESAEQSRKVLAEFRKISAKPIRAIVYT